MTLKNQRIRVTVLLLLFQSINSLLTPRVQVHGIPRCQNAGEFRTDAHLSPRQRQLATTTARPQIYDATKSPVSPSSLQVMSPGRRKGGLESFGETLSSTAYWFIQATGLALASISQSTMKSIRKSWWCSPMLLALVPPYCAIFKGTWASMPDWWNVVHMEHIAAADNANWIIGPFLGSNIAYALCGLYLMKRFRTFRRSQSGKLVFRPTKLSMLGVWVCIAGLVSLVYHYVQALGPYALAENLCYLDHAVAGSATFYFTDTVGAPSKMTWVIGVMALVTLVASTPNYASIHSCWHYLSAATAMRWAHDGFKRLPRFGTKSK